MLKAAAACWRRRLRSSVTPYSERSNRVPVLLYNSGTWAVTKSAQERLDSFHRRQLRSLIGIRWPQTISNNALHARCESQPISHTIKMLQWRIFGHVLRLSDSTPAVQTTVSYYTSTDLNGWRRRPRTSLPGTLSADLEPMPES